MHEIKDRGIIKWAPFQTLFSSKKVCEEIMNKKNVLQPPILSEDELEVIEEKILESYYDKKVLEITYYYDGKHYKITGKVCGIDKIKKQIRLDNNKKLYFKQVIKVKNV